MQLGPHSAPHQSLAWSASSWVFCFLSRFLSSVLAFHPPPFFGPRRVRLQSQQASYVPNSSLLLNAHHAVQLLKSHHPVRLVCCGALLCQEDCHLIERSRLCAHRAFHVLLLHHHEVFFAFRTDLPVVLSASVFDSCNSLHGALHFLSIRLAGPSPRTCFKTCSYSQGHRRVIPLSWHDFFFLSVLGSGSLTPVQDFTRHSVRLVDAHLVSILFRSSSLCSRSFHVVFFPECLNALRPGFHRSQASSSTCCREAVQKYMSRANVTHDVPVSKFISASSHFLICASLQYA